MKGTAVVASPLSPDQVREAERFVDSQRRETKRDEERCQERCQENNGAGRLSLNGLFRNVTSLAGPRLHKMNKFGDGFCAVTFKLVGLIESGTKKKEN